MTNRSFSGVQTGATNVNTGGESARTGSQDRKGKKQAGDSSLPDNVMNAWDPFNNASGVVKLPNGSYVGNGALKWFLETMGSFAKGLESGIAHTF